MKRSLGRLVQHLGDKAMLFISADRSENDKSTNNKNFKELQRNVRAANFGFNKLKGGYVEIDDTTKKEKEVKGENSLVVYANKDEEETLKKLGIQLGKKYKQDSILFVDTDKNVYMIATRDDSSIGTIGSTKKFGDFKVSGMSKYFSYIGKKKFHFESVEEGYTPNHMVNTLMVQESVRKMVNKYEDGFERWESSINR